MAVFYIKKDLITVRVGIVAHGVNCSGAMNSGVAKAIRARWPYVYERFCIHPKGRAVLGEVDFVYPANEELIIANCYTQVFYGYGGGKYADPEAIRKSLQRVMQIADLHGCDVYIPRMGCGLGGLDWQKEVQPIVEDVAKAYTKVDIFVCDLPEDTNATDVT